MLSEKLNLIEQGSSKLQQLKETREGLCTDLYEGLEKIEHMYAHINSENLETANKELSKLDTSLGNYGSYKQTIADLAVGLTNGLQEYVEFANKSKSFQGIGEKFYNLVGMKRRAERMRNNRISTQNPRENLQHILEYSERLYHEICQIRQVALSTYGRLQANTDVIVQKIAEFEPQEAVLKEKLEALQAKYEAKQKEYESADAQKQAEMLGEINELHKKLNEVRHDHGQILTVYSQAQQALKASELSRNSFEKMEDDLARQATMIKEKIDNITQVYLAAPEAVKVMMTTKGMETLDKTVNAATDQSVNIITQAAESVSDATLAREAIQLIDESVMRGYMQRVEQTMKDFNQRIDDVRKKAQQSQVERYGK